MSTSIILLLLIAVVLTGIVISLYVRHNTHLTNKQRKKNTFSVDEVCRNQMLIQRSARSIAF